MRHIYLVTDLRQEIVPATPTPFGRGTFRLILPEDIAIGIRFSHASCTNLDS